MKSSEISGTLEGLASCLERVEFVLEGAPDALLLELQGGGHAALAAAAAALRPAATAANAATQAGERR